MECGGIANFFFIEVNSFHLEKLEVVASFCWWLWTFNHNTSENRLEKVQGAATSSLFRPPLFQDTLPFVQFLCAERNAPCQWDLAIDKTKPPTSAAEWQGNDRSAMSGCKPLSPPGPLRYLCGLALRIWTSFWRREGSAGMDMWNASVVQSRPPYTYRLRESVGLEFISENFQFLVVKFSIYLNRRVFVMKVKEQKNCKYSTNTSRKHARIILIPLSPTCIY